MSAAKLGTHKRLLSATDWVLILSIYVTGFGLLSLLYTYPEYFRFQFNPYALLTGIEVSLCIILLTVLYNRKGNFHARMWCAVTFVGSLFLGIGELLARISTSPEQALFWTHLGIFGVVLIPIGFYMFMHFFTEVKINDKDVYLPVILIISGSFLGAAAINSDRLQLVIKSEGPWGFSQPITVAYLFIIIWLSAVILVALARLFQFARTHDQAGKKAQQAWLLAICTMVGLTGGLFLDVIPRYLGYNILPIGVLVQSIMPIGLLYAMFHYNALGVDFSIIAEDILDTVDEGIIITDTDYTIRTINRFTAELSGYTPQQLYGRPIYKLFDPAIYRQVISAIQQDLLTAKIAHIGDTIITNNKGDSIAASISVSRLKGVVPSYLFAINDITQFKKYYRLEQERNVELESANNAFKEQQKAMLNLLEDSRELSDQLAKEKAGVELTVAERTAELDAERSRLEASINSLNIGFIIVNKDSKVFTANAAYRMIIGQSNRARKPDLKLLAEPLKATFDVNKAINDCLKNGTKNTWDNLLFGEKVLRLFIAPIVGAGTLKKSLGAVVLVEDITEAKAVERSRDEFFSIASHELRTPLTAIRGNTQMMIEYYAKELSDPSLQEMVGDIHDSSIRLITIVNDFLDTSRLEQGKISFKLTNFDAVDLVKEVKQEFEAGEVNPNLYLKINTEAKLPLIYADRDRLKQCVINLVGNGFKFTEKGGVSIAIKHTDAVVKIEVTDTGKGIPAESRNLLFRKFQQASNNILTRDSTRSTGLGLYISKLIMEGMNGKIYMETSTVGKGSTFVIEIPASQNTAKNDIIVLSPTKAGISNKKGIT